jgi:hypothetical protein
MDVYCLVVSTVDERASTYDQIMKSKDRDKWMKAMEDEISQSRHRIHGSSRSCLKERKQLEVVERSN